jgi:16S rRNA (uracil1498-N3)-methyltransferase
MQRYFIHETFSKDQIHHITNVMRFKSGDKVEVCQDGTCYQVELSVNQKDVTFNIIKEVETNKSLDITLIQGLPKGDKIEDVVKLATLFGVRNIIFVPMKRSIAKLSNISFKLERLNKIMMEAAELAKRSDLVDIKFLQNLNQFSTTPDMELFVCDEDEKVLSLPEFIKSKKNLNYTFVVGPEGGIDETERVFFKSHNAKFVTLGKNILPTELAHLVVLNAIYYEEAQKTLTNGMK